MKVLDEKRPDNLSIACHTCNDSHLVLIQNLLMANFHEEAPFLVFHILEQIR